MLQSDEGKRSRSFLPTTPRGPMNASAVEHVFQEEGDMADIVDAESSISRAMGLEVARILNTLMYRLVNNFVTISCEKSA